MSVLTNDKEIWRQQARRLEEHFPTSRPRRHGRPRAGRGLHGTDGGPDLIRSLAHLNLRSHLARVCTGGGRTERPDPNLPRPVSPNSVEF